jgi:hypothetical protein
MSDSYMNTAGILYSFKQFLLFTRYIGIRLPFIFGLYCLIQLPALSQKTTTQIELESKLIDASRKKKSEILRRQSSF